MRGVPDDTSLDKVFREFKTSYLHLLVVGPGRNRSKLQLGGMAVNSRNEFSQTC